MRGCVINLEVFNVDVLYEADNLVGLDVVICNHMLMYMFRFLLIPYSKQLCCLIFLVRTRALYLSETLYIWKSRKNVTLTSRSLSGDLRRKKFVQFLFRLLPR